MRSAEAGFTLVEVLVALVVTSLLLTVVLRGASLALGRLRTTEERREALLYGHYLLLRGATLDYGGGNGHGTQGHLAWTSTEQLVLTDQRHLNGLMRIHVRILDSKAKPLFDRSTVRMKVLPQS